MNIILEIVLEILYLLLIFSMSIVIVKNVKKNRKILLIGIMSFILAFGEVMYIITRIYGNLNGGLRSVSKYLGAGKLVSSMAITLACFLLYSIWREKYKIKSGKKLTIVMAVLTVIKICLNLFPQNSWERYYQPVNWGIYRNIPIIMMGILLMLIFKWKAKNDYYNKVYIIIALALAINMVTIVFVAKYPKIENLFIAKYILNLWVVWIGFREMIMERKLIMKKNK